jgi:hypothetical protein
MTLIVSNNFQFNFCYFCSSLFLIMTLINSYSSLTIKTNGISLGQNQISLNSFANTLRSKHLTSISSVNNYITQFTQILDKKPDQIEAIKSQLKKLISNVADNIKEINNGFKENYEFCVNKLKTFNFNCDQSIDEMKKNINFNKDYACSLNKYTDHYDKNLKEYMNSDVFGIIAKIVGSNDITNKNDVVDLYTCLAKHLDSHFKIFKSEEMEKVLLEVREKELNGNKSDLNVDQFLSDVVNKYQGNPNNTQGDSDYVKKRKNLAQILFNKVSSYMNNSIERKACLIKQSEEIFIAAKKIHEEINQQISELKTQRREISELALSLHKENTLTIKKIRNCDKLTSLNSSCEESGSLFKSILHSYEVQSESMQNLFTLISKK